MSDNKGFFNPETVTQGTITAAETELQNAIEAERPDEIGANLPETPGEKPKGFVALEVPAIVDGTDWKQRYGNLQRYIDKKIKPEYQAKIDKLAKDVEDLTSKVTNLNKVGAPANLPESVEEIEKLKKESPAAFNAIVALATSIAEGIVADKVTSLEKGFDEIKKGQDENKEAAAIVSLKRLHPDFDTLSVDPAFHTWLQGQSKIFQNAIYEGYDVESADGVLKMYKATLTTGKGKSKKAGGEQEVNVGSSAAAPTGGNKSWEFTESQLAGMSSSVFDKNAEAIDKAIREGRVLLDLTDKVGTAARIAAQAV